MRRRFQRYFERLERLSTEELDRSAEKLVRGEVLIALAENRVSLTVAGMLAPHLEDDNGRRLAKARAIKTRPDEVAKVPAAPSRYVPSEVRERVHEQAGYRCEYRGRDGTRCPFRTGLEIEHEGRPSGAVKSHESSLSATLRILVFLFRLIPSGSAEPIGTAFVAPSTMEIRAESPHL
jgi:hypothetical protein